jgi:hypothetical protein
MSVSFIALAAAAAAHSAAPQSGVKWEPLQGQQAPQPSAQPAPTPVSAPQIAPATRFLPGGTQVSLTPLQELSSKHIKQGEHYQFTVVSDVTDNGLVVIPRGSMASGVVSMQTGRGIVGKSGKFEITFENVTSNGVTFPLMGVYRQEGKGNTVGALLGSMFISGHSAVMLPGQIVTAMIKDRTAY